MKGTSLHPLVSHALKQISLFLPAPDIKLLGLRHSATNPLKDFHAADFGVEQMEGSHSLTGQS